MYLVIGDWSDDGHGKYEKSLYNVNKQVTEVQQAYKNSCKLTGITFNHNFDYTERGRNHTESKKYSICTEYGKSKLSKEVIAVLKEYDCPVIEQDEDGDYIEYNFEELWWWFVGLSLPGLIFKKVEDDTPVINGYWNKTLNVQFGYGLFH